ncbi:hydantoinase/oxoprolinase family protein [Zhengella sp. ZM62]|uniref:hydantoinase/oxoprolinase family protein n=1 Tax=Zhengella sedimenti TaxID=3390035 RepID=UPI0039761219
MNRETGTSGGASRIGVEIGGTFTDLVWADGEGRLHTGKTPSTPAAIHEAVLTVIGDAGLPLEQAGGITHGSTVATNALITRKGAAVGLLTTAGFRDVVIVGRGDRDHGIYDMQYRRNPPPIRRSMIGEVPERMGADGHVIVPLDLEAAWRETEILLEKGAAAIAVSLLHAYRNPAHERAVAQMIRERAPHVAVSASHEVSPEFREYERTVTTVANAFLEPVVESYLKRLDGSLKARGYRGVLNIMQSNGGVMPTEAAGANAVRMLMSGPAAGVRAAVWFAQRNGIGDIITLDMGGTSTDIAMAPGLVPRMVPELRIDGLPLRTASIDMTTIGAGGGSIARIDEGGLLAVGPESAGSEPGPVCYGRGGVEPTVTDAQVVAGLLQPDQFFSGRIRLSRAAAEAALTPLDTDADARKAADAVLRLVNSNMAAAVRLVSTSRGIDPRDFTLVAYGGGGPLHAAMVADLLGMKQVLVPWAPGLASAFGLLIADTLIDATHSDRHRLDETSLDAARLSRLLKLADRLAEKHGIGPGDRETAIGLDMRYAGQAFELTVWTDAGTASASALRQLFEEEHRNHYGYARAGLDVEVVSYRVRVTARLGASISTPLPEGSGPAPATAEILIDGNAAEATVLARDGFAAGQRLSGPAILTEPTSTTVVPSGWEAECLSTGDLMLRRTR